MTALDGPVPMSALSQKRTLIGGPRDVRCVPMADVTLILVTTFI